MEYYRVTLEAHRNAATIYIAGLLTCLAATSTEGFIAGLTRDARVIRLDLRAVDIIDPHAFVAVARALNRWREATGGHLTIQFPERSERARTSHLRLHDQPKTIDMAVSAAINCPISTSPGKCTPRNTRDTPTSIASGMSTAASGGKATA